MLINILQTDLKKAQLDKDELRVSTLRLLLSELRYAEIKKRESEYASLSETEIIPIIQREIKKRKEAALGFRQGKREESAKKEELEADILVKYLPEQLSDEDLMVIINQVITDTGVTGINDMGKVIGFVMGKAKGSADGSRISALVKEKLGKG